MNRIIKAAKDEYENAAKKLNNAVRKIYEPGTLVTVKKGRSEFPAKVLHVTEHWWSRPTDLRVQNLNTGKVRFICVSDIVV